MSSKRHEITSVEQHEEHEGETLSTTDHDVIQRWAEERDGRPVAVEGTERAGSVGVLRIDFGAPNDRLEPVSWDDCSRCSTNAGWSSSTRSTAPTDSSPRSSGSLPRTDPAGESEP